LAKKELCEINILKIIELKQTHPAKRKWLLEYSILASTLGTCIEGIKIRYETKIPSKTVSTATSTKKDSALYFSKFINKPTKNKAPAIPKLRG
jgi:hypothetical protein